MAGAFLIFVLYEIVKRIQRKPLSVVMAQNEEDSPSVNKKEKKKRQKENESFHSRAKRVNWQVKQLYQQNIFIAATVGSSIVAFILEMPSLILAGIAAGLFFPYYQLKKKEDAFDRELPLRAEQAINAVEQQMQSDIPTFEALKKATAYMQSPIKEEYEKAIEKIERANIPIKQAVEHIPEKLNLSELEYFHMILEVAEETEEKAGDIIRDSSDTLRRRQKHRTRLIQEIASSMTEMKWMFWLVVIMVLSFRFMLDERIIPFAGTPFHLAIDLICVTISGWVTWSYMKKLKPRNII